MDVNPNLWSGKRVLVTGHTGFKGSWLVFWLKELGAEIIGLALPPQDSRPSLYSDARIGSLISHEYFLDVRDDNGVQRVIKESKPDYVFHLAAQAFVRRSLKNPSESFTTNIIGTSNVLLAALPLHNLMGITIATTDKVYQNIGNHKPFQENDRLGSKDPYSASKAAAELIVASVASTCNPNSIPITTVRAGNVIGGGDWGEDRLVPDIVKAIYSNKSLIIRNPSATRPWQYILDCLRGYILIAQAHLEYKSNIPASVNFGPTKSLSVSKLISVFEETFGRKIHSKVAEPNLVEANQLEINSKLALEYLGWSSLYSTESAIALTAEWYLRYLEGNSALDLISKELNNFKAIAK